MVTNYTPVEKNLQGGLMVYIKMDPSHIDKIVGGEDGIK